MSEKNEYIYSYISKGILIGIGTLIPGVSGGTIAILLDVYDKLIYAYGNIFKSFKESMRTLIPSASGAIIGVVAFSKILSYLCDSFPKVSRFTFCIITIVSVFLFYFKKVKNKTSINTYFPCITGILTALSIDYLLRINLISVDTESIISLISAGFVLSIALVLPGISFSYMLLFFNLYETTLKSIYQFNVPYLLSLSLGILFGSFVFSKVFTRLTEKYGNQTYSFIFGFVLLSAFQMLTEY